ncbi:hypothetical protein WG908_04930 [Sphingobium sp. AN641]|uniref:hypothetical protein n=1 Tax=Sphingobium sp. AN641 TaxID=3133443 RepID=UPI0030C01E0C
MITVTFWLLTLFTCGFATLCGGRDGRMFAIFLIVSVLLTIPAWLAGSWQGTQIWLLMVDGLFFVSLVWLMLRSPSYWPIWAAASQMMTVLTHVVTLIIETFSDRIYEGLSTVWVIPLLLFTLIGIEQDRKHSHDRPYPA